jgi:hypothetical protein
MKFTLLIYDTYHFPEFDIEEIINFIKKTFPFIEVKKRYDFFNFWSGKNDIENLAKEFVKIRVKDRKKILNNNVDIYPVEIEYEMKRLKGEIKKHGIIYDGFEFQKICAQMIEREELKIKYINIILTNQLIATFDQYDMSYHLRVVILGFPNIISTTGIIEALAKPKEYYFKIQLGYDTNILKKEFGDRIIDYRDKRITEILKGYVSQAIFYHVFGEAFCEDKGCRLYNSHWQEEAIFSQIESKYEFCEKHIKILEEICY